MQTFREKALGSAVRTIMSPIQEGVSFLGIVSLLPSISLTNYNEELWKTSYVNQEKRSVGCRSHFAYAIDPAAHEGRPGGDSKTIHTSLENEIIV